MNLLAFQNHKAVSVGSQPEIIKKKASSAVDPSKSNRAQKYQLSKGLQPLRSTGGVATHSAGSTSSLGSAKVSLGSLNNFRAEHSNVYLKTLSKNTVNT